MRQATLSKTHYDWRKIEPVTIKENFIQFWGEESEFVVKKWFHNWTSELGWIWHIFGKFGSFQALQHWQQPAAANKLNSDVQSWNQFFDYKFPLRDSGLWMLQFSFQHNKQYFIWKLTFSAKIWDIGEVAEAHSLASGGFGSDQGQSEKNLRRKS